nr:DUF3823 domain-containing protein [Chitinophagaceae bacterium]
FQLYQYGFGKVGPIDASFTQDGMYSATLFDGEYKIIVPNGQGPFIWKQTTPGIPDSVSVSVKGNTTMDLEVTPYYMIKNTVLTSSGGNVSATFSVNKIVTDSVNGKDIDDVTLYINKTQFVSPGNNIATASTAGTAITDPANISLSVAIPSLTPTQNYVFARIGLKVTGVEDRIFSPLVKLSF